MNVKPNYDVIVVGAGPAGSVAALTAAKFGLDTLLVEKRQEIGVPLRCAEAIGVDTLREFVEPDPRWVCAEIEHYRLIAPDGTSVTIPPFEPTLILERKVFDRELAHLAVMAGCTVRVKTQATGLLTEDGRVTGVKLSGIGGECEAHAKVVIAADGAESQLARWAGLRSVPRTGDVMITAQYVMGGVECDPNTCDYYLGRDIAPGGYGWVFPKGNGLANVGVGVAGDELKEDSALGYLERFVGRLFPNASPVGLVVGGIPVGGPLRRLVTDGLMLVGDAAHQADPLTAGGIGYGMLAGKMAAECAAEAIRRGDTSRQGLRQYETQWNKVHGGTQRRSYRIRELIRHLSDDTLNQIMSVAAANPVEKVGVRNMALAALKQHPKLLLELGSVLLK